MSDDNEFSEILDNEIGYIVFVTGENQNNEMCWFYASIAPSKYEDFKQAESSGEYDLADYGDVLMSGSGAAPPEDVRRKMEQEYGISDAFEQDYQKVVRKLSGLKF